MVRTENQQYKGMMIHDQSAVEMTNLGKISEEVSGLLYCVYK